MRGMVETLLKQMHHVRVIQKIAGIFAYFTKIHQVRLAKNAQLVTDRGRFHINRFRQIVHATFTLPKHTQNFQPRGLAEHFKNIRLPQ